MSGSQQTPSPVDPADPPGAPAQKRQRSLNSPPPPAHSAAVPTLGQGARRGAAAAAAEAKRKRAEAELAGAQSRLAGPTPVGPAPVTAYSCNPYGESLLQLKANTCSVSR